MYRRVIIKSLCWNLACEDCQLGLFEQLCHENTHFLAWPEMSGQDKRRCVRSYLELCGWEGENCFVHWEWEELEVCCSPDTAAAVVAAVERRTSDSHQTDGSDSH